ncbi:HIT domain-containing protein [Microterricola pindariensis]|uniref:Histidine triad nucleotide-binding protein n=1 Tax=Microterricola pindariensis TaxID=478010 RepID=A0ABX5AUU3_9MICO|nr:HIT domain-containing protein [Microterricola pindariensis]PPL18672.1 histidine triad nucleotide-binding protein [Microterricola pindariensis]
MTSLEPSIFSRIVAREIPATIVAETDNVIAFRDIAPQAPLHVVVTTKSQEYANVVELAAGDPALLAELVAVASQVAEELAPEGKTPGQFRLIFNTGPESGQTVFHVHAHVLAGTFKEGSLVGG